MKNILFIGPYRQNDGWGIAAQQYLRAMRLTNNLKTINIQTCNGVSLTDGTEFAEFEKNNFTHYDAMIQNMLPSSFCYDARVGKNIGLVHYEATMDSLDINKYRISSSLMDEVWSPFNTGFCNHKQLPVPTDISRFSKDYQTPGFIPKGSFNIYFIGENIERKNIESLVLAFHKTFTYKDNVNLIIKTGKQGQSPQASFDELTNRLKSLKEQWGLYSKPELYKKEIIVTGRMTDDELCGLHQGCHMLIVPSSGESQCMPVLDALGFGNMVATVENTGPNELFRTLNNITINSEVDVVQCVNKPMKTLYTANEWWYKPNVGDICVAMIEGYNRYKNDTKASNEKMLEYLENNFSYRAIGDKINEYIG